MKRLLTSIQSFTGTTKSEALVLLTLSTIVIVGTVGKRLLPQNSTQEILAAERIVHVLDSLQATSSTTSQLSKNKYTGQEQTAATSYQEANNPYTVAQSSPTKTTVLQGKVNLNKATERQLQMIKGVGPATAKRIIALRQQRAFRSVDDLLDVKGIGAKKLETMRPYVSAP